MKASNTAIRLHRTDGHPVLLVCIAAPADSDLLEQWEAHLRSLTLTGAVTVWSEHHLMGGTNRKEELLAHLERAACIFLLLSADFFANEECLTLMEHTLKRERNVAIIPLLVRAVDWQGSPLGKFSCLPANEVPITTWEHPDEGWVSAVRGVRRLLSDVLPTSWQPSILSKHAVTDRERMLRRLHRTYQTSQEGLLQGIAWMELGLAGHPDAVQNATHQLHKLPDRSEHLLPAGTSMLSVYDQAEGDLLILGAPGSGKSTLLLDLALGLVARAEADATFPLPVIVPLSSWAVNRPLLADWLVEQLARIYEVPRKLGRLWVEQGQVLPLLDGLDEMEKAAHPQCIAAINTYHTERLTPLVVCSRRAEYDQASIGQPLFLQDAVVVQPLSQEQVIDILQAGGMELTALQEAFIERPSVRELAVTPLMLSVLLLAYRGVPIGDLPRQEVMLEEQIWTDYVERMVRQKGADRSAHTRRPEKRYPLVQTCSWLTFLAQQMRKHQQTIFYAEYLDAQWLADPQQRTLASLTRLIPSFIIGICVSLLVSTVLDINASTTLLLIMGVLGGFVGGCLSSSHAGEAVEQGRHSRTRISRHLRNALLLGVLLAASFGLSLHPADLRAADPGYFLSDWLRDACILGLGGLLSGWAFQECVDRQAGQRVPLSLTRRQRRVRLMAWMNMFRSLPHWPAAAILGIGIGLSYGLHQVPSYGLGTGLGTGLIVASIVGPSVVLVDLVLAAALRPLRFAERIHWRWRPLFQRDHLRTTVIMAAMSFLLYGLIFGLAGLSSGLIEELSDWLGYGLGIGLSIGLVYWLFLGLYHGIQQEHLDDQDRFQFNQGIRRSLRNGLLVSLISTVIIGTISVLKVGLTAGLISGLSYGLDIGLSIGLRFGLSNGLRFGLSNGLSYGLHDGLSSGLSVGLHYGLIALITGLVVMWALVGGSTVLRHYVIRLLLARRQAFPFRAQAFLDDATNRILLRRVGGGYSFIHRRLQDYFADAAIPLPEN